MKNQRGINQSTGIDSNACILVGPITLVDLKNSKVNTVIVQLTDPGINQEQEEDPYHPRLRGKGISGI